MLSQTITNKGPDITESRMKNGPSLVEESSLSGALEGKPYRQTALFQLAECEEPQTCPPGPRTDAAEVRAIDIQRPPRAQEPQKNHCRDYRNPPREEQGRVPGEPPSIHSAEAPGSCNNKPTGPAGSRLRPSRSSHGPRDPRPRNISLPKQRPDRAQGYRPRQAAIGSVHTPKHPALDSENHKYTSGQRPQPLAGSVAGRK
ncbi:hypothetical protein ILYODFUR_024726 [Ilyodon furcidens]|uniref:Uncharacterized protein n=1 Tax=Ilyodon furcidens TaxID=33524 RepID=A0ABV0U873_9TELE